MPKVINVVVVCLLKGRLMMSKNEDNVLDNAKQESKEDNNGSKNEGDSVDYFGSWGKCTKEGNYISFRFDNVEGGIKGIGDKFVHPGFKYRKWGSREENGKKIVTLKLVGEQKVEFYEEELYKQFGVDIPKRKPRTVSHTDDEDKVYKDILVHILRDKESLKILQSKLENISKPDEVKKIIKEVKEAISMLAEPDKT